MTPTSRRRRACFIAAMAALALTAPLAASNATAAPPSVRPGVVCTEPLQQVTVTVVKKGKKVKVRYICLQDKASPETWKWALYVATQHPPFAIPAVSTWKVIPEPEVGGDPNQLTNAKQGLARLASELNYRWIEVNVEGGKTITAAVWAPKGADDLPVVVFFHGTAGMIYWEYEFAATLARAGYVVVAPVWFARTQFQDGFFPVGNMPGLIQNANAPSFTGANVETARTLLPVLRAAMDQPEADSARMALSGNSRGGTMAMIQAVTTPGMKAVIPIVAPYMVPQMNSPMYRGQVWEVLPRSVVAKMTTPTLVIAGTKDQVVPPASTQDFIDSAAKAGRSNIEYLWVDGPHQIAFSFNSVTHGQVRQATLDFLAEHV